MLVVPQILGEYLTAWRHCVGATDVNPSPRYRDTGQRRPCIQNSSTTAPNRELTSDIPRTECEAEQWSATP
jgi:hypothetical protein